MRFHVLAAALIVALGASAAAAFSAPGGGILARPDLVVNSLANPPAVVSAGDGFSARDRTRNIGKATARATVTRYYLSKGGQRTQVARRSVGLLKPGRSSAGSVAAKVPLTLDTGAYSLVACADAPGAVIETSEKNNCRTAATRIVIKKPPPRV
jgi:subtilase family serine protease